MTFKFKIINGAGFLLAAGIPFFNSWQISGHDVGNLHQITTVVVVLFLFIGADYTKLNPLRFRTLPMTRYFLLYTGMIVFSLAFSENLTDLGTQQFMYCLELAGIYLIFNLLFFDESTMDWIYYGFFAGFSVAVFIGVMQFLKVPAFALFKPDELNANTSYVSSTDAVDTLRIWGPFGNALTFSFYLAVCGTLLFYFFRFTKRNKLMAYGVLGMTLVGISLTISRTAMASFIFCISLVFFFSLSRKKRIWFLLITVGFITGAFLYLKTLSAASAIMTRLDSSGEDFKGGRYDLWVVGYKVWMQSPFFGAGPGNLSTELYRNGWTTMGKDIMDKTVGHVENFYLTILFTFGAVPFAFYVLFVIKYVKAAYALMKEGMNNPAFTRAIPLFGAVICFLINNFTNPALNSDVRIQLLFILLLSMCTNLYKEYLSGDAHVPQTLAPL